MTAFEASHTILFPEAPAASLTLLTLCTFYFNKIPQPHSSLLPVTLGVSLRSLSLARRSPCSEFLKPSAMYPGLIFPPRPISSLRFFKKLSLTHPNSVDSPSLNSVLLLRPMVHAVQKYILPFQLFYCCFYVSIQLDSKFLPEKESKKEVLFFPQHLVHYPSLNKELIRQHVQRA